MLNTPYSSGLEHQWWLFSHLEATEAASVLQLNSMPAAQASPCACGFWAEVVLLSCELLPAPGLEAIPARSQPSPTAANLPIPIEVSEASKAVLTSLRSGPET